MTTYPSRLKVSASIGRCALALAALVPAQGIAREYRLQAGDVLEIVVAGIPDLRHRVAVQLDGSVTFPLAGTLIAEGSPLSQVRARIQSAIASKVFRTRLPDGREFSRTIERDDIAATIVEYKPIFVSGDVAKSGEQTFRPHMRVRQALASSGGVASIARSGPDASVLRSDYVTAWLNTAIGLAREWRIRSELGMQAQFDARSFASGPLPEATITQISEVESEFLATRLAEHQRARNYLKQARALIEEQLAALMKEQQTETQGLIEDAREHKKAKDAFGAGNLPSRRVNDQRRAVSATSARLLQTTSQIAQVKRSLAEVIRDQQRMEDTRRVNLLAELQEARLKLNIERSKLQSAEERLVATGLRLPRAGEGTPGKFEITIFRRGIAGTERIGADPDTELLPGDLIEVALRTNGNGNGEAVWP